MPTCNICNKLVKHLKPHKRIHTEGKKFKCNDCVKMFRRVYNLNRHKQIHSRTPLSCNRCNKIYKRCDKLKTHKLKCDGIEDMCFVETDSAFDRRIVDCRIQNRLPGNVGYVIGRLAHKIENKVRKYLETFTGVKFNLWVECEFVNPDEDVCVKNLKTSLTPAFRTCNIAQIIQDKIQNLIKECEECMLKGSGWSYNRIKYIELRLNKYGLIKN